VFGFASQLSGTPYAITVRTQPSNPVQACFVQAGSGTVAGAGVAASVICAPRSCAERKLATPTEPDGTYYVDPDGSGPLAPIQVSCDQTTDHGGWTLLAWDANTFMYPNGVPYPGLAYCASLACIRGSGVPATHVNALLERSAEFGQGQSVDRLIKATFESLGTYEYAGKYSYGSLSTVSVVYGPTVCNPGGALTGTYTGLVDGGVSATVYLDQHLAYGTQDYSADTNSYIWSPASAEGPCVGNADPAPSSFLGTWAGPQYGPVLRNASGSYSVWIR